MNKTIIIDNLEIETKLHTKMDRISKIKIPKGWRLLTVTEFFNLYNNYYDKFDFENLDEVIENPSIKSRIKHPYWNVWFGSLDLRSGVIGINRNLNDDYRVRGVRFCRDVKQNKNIKNDEINQLRKINKILFQIIKQLEEDGIIVPSKKLRKYVGRIK